MTKFQYLHLLNLAVADDISDIKLHKSLVEKGMTNVKRIDVQKDLEEARKRAEHGAKTPLSRGRYELENRRMELLSRISASLSSKIDEFAQETWEPDDVPTLLARLDKFHEQVELMIKLEGQHTDDRTMYALLTTADVISDFSDEVSELWPASHYAPTSK